MHATRGVSGVSGSMQSLVKGADFFFAMLAETRMKILQILWRHRWIKVC